MQYVDDFGIKNTFEKFNGNVRFVEYSNRIGMFKNQIIDIFREYPVKKNNKTA